MYAVVEVAGKQFKVAEQDVIEIPRHGIKEGKKLELKQVVLLSKDGAVKIGTPHVAKASVATTVLGEVKGKKLVVFKMRRRKGYRRKRGHRQKYTRVLIEKIKG